MVIITINITSIEASYKNIAFWFYPKNDNRNADVLKIILSIIGGLGVFLTLYIGFKRLKISDKALILQSKAINKQSEQIELSRKSQIDERFKNAVEHLGDEKEPIILGGIVELHQIAVEDNEKYASVVFNILTSYLRSVLYVKIKRTDNFSETIPITIVEFLFKNKNNKIYEGLEAKLNHCNFSGINFKDSNFLSADFSFSYMPSQISDTNFDGAKFSRTSFSQSKMECVSFKRAEFFDNLFNYARLVEVDFREAKLSSQVFLNTQFYNCDFSNSKVSTSKLLLCYFEDVNYIDSKILNVNFSGSNFVKVNFKTNKIFNNISFICSSFQQTTFNSKCVNCDFTGINSKHIHEHVLIENLKDGIQRPIDKNGIIELEDNLFLKCKWDILSNDDYLNLENTIKNVVTDWEAKFPKPMKKM